MKFKSERERAIEYKRNYGKTLYFVDDNGDEYWYSEKDTKRHYTRFEG